MEKYSHKEILKALNIIQEICSKSTCSECPFYRNGCAITLNSPDEWEILDEDRPVWRAFC